MGIRIVPHFPGWLSEVNLSGGAGNCFSGSQARCANLPSMFRWFTLTSYLMISARERQVIPSLSGLLVGTHMANLSSVVIGTQGISATDAHQMPALVAWGAIPNDAGTFHALPDSKGHI